MNSEEISLKELILILIRGWKIILSCTIIVVLISCISVYFLNYTSYNSEIRYKFNVKDSYSTKYGNYNNTSVLPDSIITLLNNKEFLELISKDSKISDLTTLSFTLENQNDLIIRYVSVDPKNVIKVMDSTKKYIEKYINYKFQNEAISTLKLTYQTEIDITNRSSSFNQTLIKSYQIKQNNTSKFIENGVINPAYEVILTQITYLELKEIELQERINLLNNQYEELKLLKYDTFESYILGSNHLDELMIQFDISSNEILVLKTNRFNVLFSTFISTIIGFMFGVLIVYFIEYWRNN